MDALTDSPLAITLPILALLDGLSIGTLLVPLFLLLAPGRVRAGRVLAYLATITVFYLAVGVLFSLGLLNLVDAAGDALSSPAGRIIRLVVGVGMLVIALLMPSGSRQTSAATTEEPVPAPAPVVAGRGDSGESSRTALTPPAPVQAAGARPASPRSSRLDRWRASLSSERSGIPVVMGVAVAAGLVEVATMLPYIAGMTMLAGTDLSFAVRCVILAGYCIVMILPALLLLGARAVAGRAVEPLLDRLARWMRRNAAETTAWIVGIVGFLVARGAADELGLFRWLGESSIG